MVSGPLKTHLYATDATPTKPYIWVDMRGMEPHGQWTQLHSHVLLLHLGNFALVAHQSRCLGGSDIQYGTFTTSELSTSVLGPANQKRAVRHHTPAASNKMVPSTAGAKLKVTAVIGYTVGSMKITTQNISHMKDTHPTGILHLQGRSSVYWVTTSCMHYNAKTDGRKMSKWLGWG